MHALIRLSGPNGQFLASARQAGVDIWQQNGNNQFKLLKTLPAPEGISRIRDIAFVDSTLSALNAIGEGPGVEGQLDTWNIQTGSQPIRTEPVDSDYTDEIASLSPDGKYLAKQKPKLVPIALNALRVEEITPRQMVANQSVGSY